MSVIQKTLEYSKFKFYKRNREIKIDSLLESVQEKNLLHVHPIIVSKDFYVIDGQHRLKVAQELKVPIYFIVAEELCDETLALHQVQKKWTPLDYLHYYVDTNDDYRFVYHLHETYKFPLNFIIKVLSSSRKRDSDFKKGKFKISKERDRNEIIKSFENLKLCAENCAQYAEDKKFSMTGLFALWPIVNHEEYNHDRFIERINWYPDSVRKAFKFLDPQYIREEILGNVYNFKSKTKLEIKK